jgi:hypothetical protein
LLRQSGTGRKGFKTAVIAAATGNVAAARNLHVSDVSRDTFRAPLKHIATDYARTNTG